jgi:hypothetical protein
MENFMHRTFYKVMSFGFALLLIAQTDFATAGFGSALPSTSERFVAASVLPSTPAGWSSQTGFRKGETSAQRNIVAAALRSVGQSSGQSMTNGTWLTDVAGGDGARMRAAISRYNSWTGQRRISLDQIKAQMLTDFSSSAYGQAQKLALVNQIIDRYNAAARLGPVRLPNNDNETLYFLGIRKQCLEWAMTTAQSGGGGSRNYSSPGVSDPSLFRPGMGLYKNDRSHAMIIADIRWDAAGRPVEFKVIESNWGTGWINPLGMVPWNRNVDARNIPYDPSQYKVIDYER